MKSPGRCRIDGPARAAIAGERRRSSSPAVSTRRSRSASGWRRSTSVCDSASVAARLTRAGTVFVGHQSAQASGDYITGSNHVLPTSGAARGRGGLSAADFVRVTTVQTLSRAGLLAVAPHAIALARPKAESGFAATPPRGRYGSGEHANETAPEREHRRLLTGRARDASAPRTIRRRVLSGLRHGATTPSPGSSACPSIICC